MTTKCNQNTVTIAGSGENKTTVKKKEIAMTVVLFDLFATWFLYLALVALKPFQKISESDIEGGTLSADDFTAMIPMIPHKESAEKL